MTRASDRLLLSGGGIVFVCLVVILIYQVLLPFLLIIWTSLKVAHPGDPEFLELSFTTANYFRAFAIREFWEASLNTFYFASVSTLFSFVLGTFLAWTVVRTNTPLAQLIGHESFEGNQRNRCIKDLRKPVVGRKFTRELFSKKPGGHNDVVGLAEPPDDEVTEAGADRHADNERAGQHGDGNRHTGYDGKIGAPVMGEAPAKKDAGAHVQAIRLSRQSASSKRCSNLAARSALCVTTIKMAFWRC